MSELLDLAAAIPRMPWEFVAGVAVGAGSVALWVALSMLREVRDDMPPDSHTERRSERREYRDRRDHDA